MAVNIKQYTLNVAKSLGYITEDLVRDNTIYTTVTENKDTVRELYQGIKDFAKDPLGRIKNTKAVQDYAPIVTDGFNNLLEDIKTGKFYNKDREDQAIMDAIGGDWDFGSDNDFGDFDTSNFDDFGEDLNVSEEPATEGSSALAAAKMQEVASIKNIKAMDVVGRTTAKAINTTTARSAQYIVQAQQAATQALINQQSKMFNQVSIGLTGITQSLGTIVSLGEPLTAHMQNSLQFYTSTGEKLDKMINLLTDIQKNTGPVESKTTSRKSYSGIDSYLSGGALNLSNLKEMLKGNFSKAIDSSMFGMLANTQLSDDKTVLAKQMASNPLGTLLTFMVPALLPKKFKESFENLGNMLAGFNTQMIKKLSGLRNSDNPLKAFIGELFGYDDTFSKNVNVANYEKGKVDFDGKTRKAIIEVIPTYLSKILSALTGGFETRFDYDTGRFRNRQEIYAERENKLNDAAKNVGADFYDLAEDKEFKESSFASRNMTEADYKKLFKKYFRNALEKNTLIDPHKKYDSEDAKKFGLSSLKELQDIQNMYKYLEATHQYHKIAQLDGELNRQRIAMSEYFDDKGDSIFTNLDNGGFDNYTFGHSRMAVGGTAGAAMNMNVAKFNTNAAKARNTVKLSETDFKKIMDEMKNLSDSEKRAFRNEYDRLFNAKSYTSDEARQKFIDDLNDRARRHAFSFDIDDVDEEGEAPTGIKGVIRKIKKIYEAPLSVVADVLNKADRTLYEIIYGKVDEEGNQEEDREHKSILGMMFSQMKSMFMEFKDFVHKKILDPMHEWFKDKGGIKGILSNFFGFDIDVAAQMAKDKVKEIAKNVGANFRAVGKWSVDQLRNTFGNSASGSGIVDAEDYYGGASRRHRRRRRNRRNTEQNNTTEAKQEEVRERIEAVKAATQELITDPDSPVQQTLTQANNAVMTFLHHIVPDDKDLDKTAETAKKTIKTSLEALKLDPSGAITGALMGGGLSILSGGIISPMLAASIGAAAGLTIKSKKVQDMLFGEEVDGERQGGLLNKEMTDFLTKELPSVAGFSIAGGLTNILGIVPGGPISGLVIGAGIGFARKSKTVQEFLYGTESGTYGILGSAEDKKARIDWIKKMAPKAAAGALIGAVAGPFGFVGNILGGTVLGFASETEAFKRAMFGEEVDSGEKDENGNPIMVRKGGITGWIREDIIKPVASALQPINAELKYKSRNFLRILSNGISNVFRKHLVVPLRDKLFDFARGPLGRLLTKVGSGIGGVISAPFRAIGEYGNRLRRRQVRQGRADYMTAAQRLAYRRENGLGNDQYVEFDTNLMGMEAADLESLRNSIKNVRANKEFRKSDKQALEKQQSIITTVSHTLGSKAGKVALKSVRAGKDAAGIIADLQAAGYDTSAVADAINTAYNEYTTAANDRSRFSQQTQNVINDIMRRTGLKTFTDKDAMKAMDQINAEIHARTKGNVAAVKQDPVAVQNTLIKEHGENIEAKLVDIYNALIQGLPIGKKAKRKLYHHGGTADLARAREEAESAEHESNTTEGDRRVRVMNSRTGRETLHSRIFMNSQYRHADPLMIFDDEERAEIQDAANKLAQNESNSIVQGNTSIVPINGLDNVYELTCNDKSIHVKVSSAGQLSYVGGLELFAMKVKALAKKGARGIGKTLSTAGKVAKTVVKGAAKGIGTVARGVGKVGSYLFARYNPEEDEDYINTINNNNSGEGSGLRRSLRWYRRFRGGASDEGTEDPSGEVYDTITGETISRSKNASGEMEETVSDAGNRKAARKRESIFGNFAAMGGGITMMTGLLSQIKDAIAGNQKEKKPGLFEKLSDMIGKTLLGENGLLAGLFGFLTGATSGTGLIGKLLSKFNVSSFVSILGLAAILSGELDETAHNINPGYGSPEDRETITGDNGEKLHEATAEEAAASGGALKEGDLTADGKTRYTGKANYSTGDTATLSELGWKSVARGITTGRGTVAAVASRALQKPVTGTTVTNTAAKIAGNAVNLIDDVARTAYTGIHQILSKLVELFPGKLGALADKIDDMSFKLFIKIKNGLTKEAAEKAVKHALLVVKFAFIGIDFTAGYEDARTTLGIIDEPTIPQRILAGVFRALKNCLPIFDLIPDSTCVDVLCEYIAPVFGIDVEELKAKRAEAEEAVELYNQSTYAQENGISIDSVEQYNKQVLKDLTWTERSGNAIKSTFADIKTGAQNYAANVKEKGFLQGTGDTISNLVTDMTTAFTEGSKAQGGGLAGLASGMGSAFERLLPGVLGDIAKAKGDIFSYAFKGEFGNLWKVTLPDFSGGTDSNGDNIVEAVPGIFSTIIGQIPLITTKAIATPVAAVSWVGNKIYDAIKPIIDTVVSSVTSLSQSNDELDRLAFNADFSGIFKYNPMTNVAEDNPLGGILHGIIFAKKLFSFPVAGVSWVGHKIADGIATVIDGAKNIFNGIGSDISTAYQYVKDGDVTGLLGSELQIDDSNPMADIFRSIYSVNKYFYVPAAGISWVGHKIGNGISSVVNGVKNGFIQFMQGSDQIDSYIADGDVSGLLASEQPESEDNPASGFITGLYNVKKIMNVPLAGISWVGHKLGDGILSEIELIKSQATILGTAFNNYSEYADEGDIGKIWEEQTTFTSGTIIDPIFGTINGVGQVVYTVVAAIKKVVGPVLDFIGGVADTAENIADAVGSWASDTWDSVTDFFSTLWNGAGSGLPRSKFSGGSSFVSQVDPSVAGQTFGQSTIGQKGCAPAVASMISGMPLNMTANAAVRGGYTNQGGTSANYFRDILGANGIPAEYVYTGAGSPQDYLESKIANGQPTILLGQDASNTSKANSPFGPGNHYVLATGEDSHGNIIVQDPESSRPNIAYKRSILNNVKLGIPTGGSSKIVKFPSKRSLRRFRGGDAALDDRVAMTGSTTPVTYSPATVENYMHENLGSFSMPTAEQLNDFIKKKKSNSPFVGNGQVFIDAAIASGLDPRYILAHAAVESGWGTSRYARERGNYFGIGAFDSNPDNAYTMGDTLRAGIIEGAKWIAKNYYHGKYGQTSIYKMRYNGGVHQYCTSTTWVNTIAKIMSGMPANTKLMLTDTNGLAVSSMSDVPTGTSTTASSSSYTSAAVNSAIENTYNGDTSTSGTSTFDSLGTMFGKLFSSAFGGVGKLFGFDFSDSSSSSGTLVDHSAGKDSGGSDTYGDTTTANTVLAGIPFDDSTPQGKSQRALVEKMASLAGTLDYSMDGPRDPSKGSADCSSTVNWVYKNVLGTDVGNTTYAMYTDPDLSTIDMATGLSKSSYNNRTSGPNLNNLQPGDVVLYSRNGSYTSGRDYKIGHVSMYMGDGKVLSHGGGKGPVVRDLTGDTTYVMARRYTPFVNNTYNHSDEVMANTAGAPYSSSKAAELEAQRQKELEQAYRTGAYVGQDTSTYNQSNYTEQITSLNDSGYDSSKPDSASNIKPINAFSNNDKYAPPLPPTGSGSGLVRYNIAQDGYNSVTRRHRGAKSVFGGSSGLVNLSKYTAARKAKYYMQTLNDLRGGDSGIGNEVLIPLIKGIISLLTNVSANSDQIKEAVVLLNKILEKTGTSTGINSTDIHATEKHIGAEDNDETIMEMQKLLQNLASGA